MVTLLAPARTMRRCQCFWTPNSRSANAPISIFDLTLGDAGTEQVFPLDGVEQLERLGLGGLQLGAAHIFGKGQHGHGQSLATQA